MTTLEHSIGLLVVGHGTRHEQGQQDFWTTVRHVAEELPDTVVEGCFLEAVPPDIPTALEAMARRGLQEVVLVPLLLFSAGHAERDIPAAAAQAAAQTGLRGGRPPVLGCHSADPGALRRSDFHGRRPRHVARDVLWLAVGRGSRDPTARAEMDRFVAARLALTPVGRVVVAFLAMADPRWKPCCPQVAAIDDVPTVVVQPHLLYPGTLFSRLQQLVAEQDRWPAPATLDVGGVFGVRPSRWPGWLSNGSATRPPGSPTAISGSRPLPPAPPSRHTRGAGKIIPFADFRVKHTIPPLLDRSHGPLSGTQTGGHGVQYSLAGYDFQLAQIV